MKNVKRDMQIFKATVDMRRRLFISVPLTGIIRAEWALARWGQVVPCNWSQAEVVQWLDQFSPMGFLVADARNVAIQQMMLSNYEWILFIDHDVVMPPDTFTRLNEYMLKGDIPIVGGLYFTKSMPSEPLMYQGRGTSYATDWKMGDKVWVDGMGLGCTLIHRSIFDAVWKEAEPYQVGAAAVRRVFETPARSWYDAENATWKTEGGTEDLVFFSRMIDNGILKKAGWPKYQKMKYPLLCDTNIYCRHIDWNGIQYPANGEDKKFMKKEK
jgi:hypothetical protein